MKNKINKDNINEIIKLYSEENQSSEKIAKIYNCAPHTILTWLHKYGVKIKSTLKLKKCNENYFEKIDTPNKAYFLGLMYADGCIIDKKRGQKQLVINLQEIDVEILNAFKTDLQFEGNLHFYNYNHKKRGRYNRSNLYRLTVSSDKLCDDLIKLGCFSRKTYTVKFPNENQVPANLMNHFIRGLLDGDGYISIRKGRYEKSNPSFLFGIVGTLEICEGAKQWLAKTLMLDPNLKLRKIKCIYGLSFSRNKDIVKIYDYLYPAGVQTFLSRKRDKIKQIFNYKYNNSLSYEERLSKSSV